MGLRICRQTGFCRLETEWDISASYSECIEVRPVAGSYKATVLRPVT